MPGTKVGVNKCLHHPGNIVRLKCQIPLPDRAPTSDCLSPTWFSLSCLLFHSKERAMAKGNSVHVDIGVNVTACAGDLFHPSMASLDALKIDHVSESARVGAAGWHTTS